ncbi:MAG: peptidylprolyl isomerase [Roseiflexus castenholzii]|uniref:peptidylprolyl isomerase n=1 Tax=Roseiflexus castenholzii TaxID=120962 RepID=UPI000CBA5C31|nr:MAG: peptidylprolyl isomerase [Roseiflexus castenholzii]
MSQASRNKKGQEPAPQGVSPAGIIAAVAVIAVLVVLGLMLAQSSGRPQVIEPTVPPFAAATPATGGVPGPLPADVAARNGFYTAPPPMTIDPSKTYTATITTPRGDIVIRLRPDLAPETVNNFVFLAREGFYDGVTWHRVLPNFMAQGGDPSGTGMGGPGYTIKDEFGPTMIFDRPGIVAMARTAMPNSAGSQFFITTAPAPHLNGQYTIFGEVIEGQEIVNGIPLRDPDANPSGPGEQMLKVTITEQ